MTMHALGALEPLLDILADRIAERVAQRLEERLGALSSGTPLLTKQQLATALGVSIASIDRYIRDGRIAPTLRLGGPDGPQRFELSKVTEALAKGTTSSHNHVDSTPRLLRRNRR